MRQEGVLQDRKGLTSKDRFRVEIRHAEQVSSQEWVLVVAQITKMANQPESYWHSENGGLVHLLMQEQRQKKSQRETKKRRRRKHEGHELWRHEEKEEW